MYRNKPKLFRLTKIGYSLVKEAFNKKFDSISDFAKETKEHRQTFTKFYNGDGVERDTAKGYCELLQVPNWIEDWDKLFEIVPDAITDWNVYEEKYWVGRKALISELTKVLNDKCRLLVLLGITGIGKTALAQCIADGIQLRFNKVLRVNFDADDRPKDFATVGGRWLEELGLNLAIADQQPQAIVKELTNYLRDERVLVLIDSMEALLTEGANGWGDFEDEWWAKFFENFLALDSSQSCVIVTSQDLPTHLNNLASRYPNAYRREILQGLLADEQMALFAKAGLDVSAESRDKSILERIGKIYRGHPLTLRIMSGEMVESFGGNARAYWNYIGSEIELAEKDLAEAETEAKLQGADDNWKLHKLTRKLQMELYERRVKKVFQRLRTQNVDAYLLICVAAIYRRPVQEEGWLLQLEQWMKRLKKQVYTLEQQREVLVELSNRYLVEQYFNDEHRLLGMHNLVRSVALEHRKGLLKGGLEHGN